MSTSIARQCTWQAGFDDDPAPTANNFHPSRERRLAHWSRTGGRCWYCGKSPHPPNRYILDHVIPLRRGGSHHDLNLAPSCIQCNLSKGCRTVEEFRAYLWEKTYSFRPEQIAFLETLGLTLPPTDEWPKITFAFEREGWHEHGG